MNIEKVLEVFAKSVEPVVLSEHFMIWGGDNLVDVCRFTGLHKDFIDWFPSWGDYATYVKEHDNIFKVFTENGHYEVPVGSWLVKAPDDKVYPCGEGVRFISNARNIQDKLARMLDDEKQIDIPVGKEEPMTTYYPEDPFETEVYEEGNSVGVRHKLDENGRPIFKKNYSGLSKFAASEWRKDRKLKSTYKDDIIKHVNSKPAEWERRFYDELKKWK